MKKEELEQIIESKVNEAVKPLTEKSGEVPSVITESRTPEEYEVRKGQEGIGAARMVRAITAAKGDPERAAVFAKKAWEDKLGEKIAGRFSKAAEATDFDSAGFMLQEDFSNEIIELLRPRSVMRAIGTPVVPLPRGTMTLPKQTGDVSAAYVGESQDITKSEPSGGQIQLTARKLAALVPISNDLLMYSAGDQADSFVRNTMIKQIGTREDQAFLRDDGTAHTPKGLRHWIASGNVESQSGTTSSDIETDLLKLVENLEGNNVAMDSTVWIMSSRTKNYLRKLRDSNGNKIYEEISGANPTLHGMPVFVSNNVPTNLGGSSNETEIYLVNASDLLIGQAGGMEVAVDPGASYVEGGSLVSAFSRDQQVIRMIQRHDFAMVYDVAGSVLTGVNFDAP